MITPSSSALHFAIVVSRFNEPVTSGLLTGARAALADAGVADGNVTVVHVPGAFEIPLAARALAASGRFNGVICLGCLIKGDTMHFEYIASAAAQGIMEAGLASGIPVTFGVLTTLTDAQAEERAAPGPANKGREAAQAAIDMTAALRDIQARFGR